LPLIDLTVPLREGMPVWPGDSVPRISYQRSFEAGDKNNVSSVAMGLHTGTHMDAPKHFIPGAGGMETLPLDTIIGPARVIEIENPDRVEAEELRGKNIGGATRVLIKTRNPGARWWEKPFDPDFVT
jgi:arylformamidase